jgi:hypothetical protein
MAKPKVGLAELERRRSIVERWRRSGQSAPSFAKVQGMSHWTLYSWASRVGARPGRRQSGRGQDRAPAVRADRGRRFAATPSKATIDLVPVRLLSERASFDPAGRGSGDGVLEIHLRGGDVVRVLGDVPAGRVQEVVSAVRQAC